MLQKQTIFLRGQDIDESAILALKKDFKYKQFKIDIDLTNQEWVEKFYNFLDE